MSFQADIAAIAEEHGPQVAIEYTAIRCKDLWRDCWNALTELNQTEVTHVL